MSSEHLSDAIIEAYVDQELPANACNAVEAHLALCQRCNDVARALSDVSHTVANAAPAECLFCPRGQFWTQLSTQLSSPLDGNSLSGMLALLPPLLLGALGLALSAISWFISMVAALAWAGIIPPLAESLSRFAATQLPQPDIPILIRWGLNAVAEGMQLVQNVTSRWPSPLGAIIQFGLVQGMLTLGLAVTVALFATWALCLPDMFISKGGTLS